MATYHWLFLALPGGLPETMIGADPAWWVRRSCAAGPPTRTRSRPRRSRSTCGGPAASSNPARTPPDPPWPGRSTRTTSNCPASRSATGPHDVSVWVNPCTSTTRSRPGPEGAVDSRRHPVTGWATLPHRGALDDAVQGAGWTGMVGHAGSLA